MSPRRFALMRREEINAEPSVKAEGIVFHGGPVVVFWVRQQTLRVHSSIDAIEFLDDPEGLMLVWIDPDPDEVLKAQLEESTKMEGFSLTGGVIDETQGFLVEPEFDDTGELAAVSLAGTEVTFPVGQLSPEFEELIAGMGKKPAPRRAREDSALSPLGISAPGRRYAFTEIPTDHGSILIRDDALYPERGPA